MKRLSTARLLELGASLSEAERELVRVTGFLRLMSHKQAAVVLGAQDTQSGRRAARRTLTRLTEQGVLARLDRRQGGVRAGSSGHLYYPGPAAQRLLAYWDGRGLTRGRLRPDPGSRYVRHRLAVSDIYVQLIQADRDGAIDLLQFEAEPDCWRTFTDSFGGERVLKPDAGTRIGVGAYEDSYMLEVDLSTESLNVVTAKLKTYQDYFRSGIEQQAHGVFPHVLVLVDNEKRQAAIAERCSWLPEMTARLFTVTTHARALTVMTGQFGVSNESEASL
jgi:Replication-relaxation